MTGRGFGDIVDNEAAWESQVAVVAVGSVPTRRTVGMVGKDVADGDNCLERNFHWFTRRPSGWSQATGSPRPGGHAQHVRRNKSEIAFFSFSSLSDQGSFCLPANKSSKLGKAARIFPKQTAQGI